MAVQLGPAGTRRRPAITTRGTVITMAWRAHSVTIALLTLVAVVTALLATWYPARQATRVDPKVLLRN